MKPYSIKKARENKLLGEESEEDRLILTINEYIKLKSENKQASYNIICRYSSSFFLADKIKRIYELEGYIVKWNIIDNDNYITFSISW
jgi:hypothetical protein